VGPSQKRKPTITTKQRLLTKREDVGTAACTVAAADMGHTASFSAPSLNFSRCSLLGINAWKT